MKFTKCKESHQTSEFNELDEVRFKVEFEGCKESDFKICMTGKYGSIYNSIIYIKDGITVKMPLKEHPISKEPLLGVEFKLCSCDSIKDKVFSVSMEYDPD